MVVVRGDGVLDPGHVGERHGGVELDVGAADPPTLPLVLAVVAISGRHGAWRDLVSYPVELG
jgi:hypothetical protein